MPYSNNYNSFGMSPIRRRNPIGMNINAFADAVTKLDAKYQQQAQQQSAIDMALAQLPVNAAEDAWRMGLSDEIKAQIDAVDNPNDRLLTSIKAAGQLMNRPDVIGRIRAQADYKNFVEQTQKRNDIDQRTKNWAIETNPYSYQDIKDSTGKIVGGSEWKAKSTPVANVNLADIATRALSWVKPNSQSGSKTTFIDAEGNPTDDISKAAFIGYVTENGVVNLGEDKLKQAIQAALTTTQGAMDSINQDYDIALWEYNKLSDEEKRNFAGNAVVDSNGNIKKREDYINNLFNNFTKAAAYTQTTNKVTYDDTYVKYLATKAASAPAAGGLNPYSQGSNDSSAGPAIQYELTDVYGSAKSSIDNAISRAENVYNVLSKNKNWESYKRNKDYDGMINLLTDTIDNLATSGGNIEQITALEGAIQGIKNNKQIVSRLTEGLGKRDKDLIDFGLSYNTGSSFSENNDVVKSINLGLTKAFSKNGKTPRSYQVRFNDDEELTEVMRDLNLLNDGDLKGKGIVRSAEDGRPTLTIDASNPLLYKLLNSTQNHYDDLFHMPGKGTEIRSLDESGNILKSVDRALGRSGFMSSLANIIDYGIHGDESAGAALLHMNTVIELSMPDAMGKVNNAGGKISTVNQGTLMDDPVIARYREQAGDDIESQSKLQTAISLRNKTVANELTNMDYTQTRIFGYNDDVNVLTNLGNVDRKELANKVAAYLTKDRATWQYYSDGNLHGYLVTLNPTLDKNDNVVGQKEQYFIPSDGISNEAIDAFNNDSKFKAKQEYTQRRSTGSGYTTKFGKTYDVLSNDGGYIGKEWHSQQEVENDIEIDKLIESASSLYKRRVRTKGIADAVSQVEKDANIIAAYQGIRPNGENDMQYATYIQYLINLIKTAQ